MPGNYSGPPRRDDDVLSEVRDLVEAMREKMFGGGSATNGSTPHRRPLSPWPILAIALVLYLGAGFFIVAPDQRGVVLRFGKVVREVGPGPGYHLPWPIEEVFKPAVTQIQKEEFGFRTIDVGPPARYRDVDQEALMLTGDENIVKAQFIVQYRVKSDPHAPLDYLFNVRDPRDTVRVASEAAMRQVIGSNKIDDVLTEDRERIQTEAKEMLQGILDGYASGLKIDFVKLQDVDPPDQVSDAFKDVINAQQDGERMINEARGYANDVLPKARGEAAQVANKAEGYKLAKVQEAQGAAQRFDALYEAYIKAKDVTRTRLYLEAMEDILPHMDKVVIDEKSGERVVPYLPLDQMMRLRTAPEAGAPEASAPQASAPAAKR